jgi:hypothetical protein
MQCSVGYTNQLLLDQVVRPYERVWDVLDSEMEVVIELVCAWCNRDREFAKVGKIVARLTSDSRGCWHRIDFALIR